MKQSGWAKAAGLNHGRFWWSQPVGPRSTRRGHAHAGASPAPALLQDPTCTPRGGPRTAPDTGPGPDAPCGDSPGVKVTQPPSCSKHSQRGRPPPAPNLPPAKRAAHPPLLAEQEEGP